MLSLVLGVSEDQMCLWDSVLKNATIHCLIETLICRLELTAGAWALCLTLLREKGSQVPALVSPTGWPQGHSNTHHSPLIQSSQRKTPKRLLQVPLQWTKGWWRDGRES